MEVKNQEGQGPLCAVVPLMMMTDIQRQDGDLISLFPFLESRLKTELFYKRKKKRYSCT
jgi:hypothetical protein